VLGGKFVVGGRVKEDHVRLPNDWLEAVVFLYPTEQDAFQGSQTGGSGFVVGVPFEGAQNKFHPYVITNSHVARRNPTVRTLFRTPLNINAVTFDDEEWLHHPDADDVAVAALPLQLPLRLIPISFFLTEDQLQQLDLGPGDDAFMLVSRPAER
jgi:hypothetical protein